MEGIIWALFALWYICGVIWDILAVTEVRPYRVIDILGTLVLAITGPLWPLWVHLKARSNNVLFNKR